MQKPPVKKPRINLSDYNYEQDLDYRLQMASFSQFEVALLEVILDGSLTISFQELQNELNVIEDEMILSLEKFSRLKLLQIQDKKIVVNKEKRKYFELHILRFNSTFEPSIEFLQGLLNQVPIHVLPSWYMISKTTSHIVHSIIDRHLLTPRTFEKYVTELEVEDPLLHAIASEVFAAADFSLPVSVLKDKYQLQEKEFAECLMLLEFNLLCSSKYELSENGWKEYLIPFHEWAEILRFRKNTQPQSISNVDHIQKWHPSPFGFVHDLAIITRFLGRQSIPSPLIQDKITELLPHISSLIHPDTYMMRLLQQLAHLNLSQEKDNAFTQHPSAAEWLQKDVEQQALIVYQTSILHFYESQPLFYDRDVREILRSLKVLYKNGWIAFEDFIKSFIAPVGSAEMVTLTLKGKKWRYTFPTYSPEEKDLIKLFLFQYLLEGGIITTGTFSGKDCFCITSFGYHILEDYF